MAQSKGGMSPGMVMMALNDPHTFGVLKKINFCGKQTSASLASQTSCLTDQAY